MTRTTTATARTAESNGAMFSRPNYGLCRAVTGHSWEFVRRVLVVTADDALLRLQCGRCGTERQDRVSLKHGTIESRTYKHPEDYKLRLDEGEKTPSRAVQRRAAIASLKRIDETVSKASKAAKAKEQTGT